MDRKTIYAGQVPLETDLLTAQQFAMTALAELSQSVFGSPTLASGFTCTPTTPASLNVILTPGSIYQMENLEQSIWSSLAANLTNTIMKQGILLNPQTFGIVPPGTVGFSQNFLLEVQYQDNDTGSTVLPYFNAANPSQPFSGPGNAGTAQNTVRQGLAFAQLKAGTAAATGTQTTPAPDAGYAGLFVITVANGAVTITAGNITTYANAPFLAINGYLPQIPTGVQDSTWTYAADTSTGGAPITTTAQTLNTNNVLTFASVPAYVTVGMKAFDLTTVAGITGGQTVSSVTSTTVTLSGNVNATVNSGDQISFSNNAYVATIAPTPTLTTGLHIAVKINSGNTASATLNLNGLGAVTIHRANGSVLAPGDIAAGQVVDLRYDGAFFQVVNFEGLTSASTVNNNTTTIGIPYATDSGTTNAVIGNFSPAITSLSAGLTIEVKIANTNTGTATMQCNSVAAVGIVGLYGNALTGGELKVGEVALMIYNGTAFQLVYRPFGLINVQVFTTSGNYTPTAGATKALVFATGGGGSGSVIQSCGSGGGAGATAIGFLSVVGIGSVACTIGAGGAAVTGTNLNGNSGGATSFGSTAVAGGGAGGTRDNGTGDGFAGLGGTATAGIMLISGGDGESQGGGNNINGGGGASFWGGGGAGFGNNALGQNARCFGGGGGGADNVGSNNTSGAGDQGVILILEF